MAGSPQEGLRAGREAGVSEAPGSLAPGKAASEKPRGKEPRRVLGRRSRPIDRVD